MPDVAKNANSSQDRYVFLAEWMDPQSGVTWTFQVMYYPVDGTVEMFDVKNRRAFLKRCEYPAVKAENLFVGAIISVYARQLKLVDYGDEYTRRCLEFTQESAFIMILPDAVERTGQIVQHLNDKHLIVSRLKMCRLAEPDAQVLLEEMRKESRIVEGSDRLAKGSIVAIEVIGENSVSCCRDMKHIMEENNGYGVDECIWAPESSQSIEMAISYLFASKKQLAFRTASLGTDCTCAIVKPHAVKEKVAGEILQLLSKMFTVSAMEQFVLNRTNAAEFLEVYRGVVAEYSYMVDELASGPLIALELKTKGGEDGNVVEQLRRFCGPRDPKIAKELRPDTLRAQFGKDKVYNAIHCTDLPEDGQLESTYFFEILQE